MLDTILVTGYAKAPQGTSMYEVYKHFGIVLEIDRKTYEIVDVELTLVTSLAQSYFKRLIIGYDLNEGIDPLMKKINENYYAPSVNSVNVALRTAFQRFKEQVQAS